MDYGLIQTIAIYALPVVFAITLHEAAHGYVAKHYGDLTAYAAGRISLNPLRHIDPIGTVVLPLILLAVSKLFGAGIIFGWAKPVPVNFSNLRNPKRDMLWVAAAGPFANFAMALLWAFAIKSGLWLEGGYFGLPLVLMGAAGVFINAIIMMLNLLPLPPLDGGRILVSLLPHRLAYNVARLEPYGFIILIVLLFVGALGIILWPLIHGVVVLIEWLLGLPGGIVFRLLSAI